VDGVPEVGVAVPPVCGVSTVPVTAVLGVDGVPGVPPVTKAVCAAAVCLANSSIIAIGFSTEGKGETNRPVGINVGVAAGGVESGISQAESNIAPINVSATISKPRCF
jgi:hypothetical protein